MPVKKNKEGLTAKQQRFCEEYLVDLNATQAAMRAGYSKKSAHAIGIENLSKPIIADYLKKRQSNLSERTEVTQEMVIKELAAIAFSDVTDVAEVKNVELYDKDGNPFTIKGVDVALTKLIESDTRKAIASIKQNSTGIEVKMHDKIKALDKLAEHLGMYNRDRTEIEWQRLALEKKRYELEAKKAESDTVDKDIKILIGGLEKEWSE